MERRADGWLFATYAWNADASDAVLAPERGVKRARTEPSGARFDIPSRADCRVCHETGPSSVLGFSALQLSSDRDPLAPHAAPPDAGSVDLDELLERGLLASAPESWRDAPPRIEASTPRGRAALGYLSANCGQCHTADGALSELGLALDYPLARASRGAPALATAVGRTSSFRTPGARGDELRIAPGDPDASVLLARVRSKDALLRMPPLGTHVPDEAALLLLETWIREDLVASRGEDQLLIETASNR
jgi:hypothetical protein